MLAWFAKYAHGVDWQMLERMDDVRFVNEGHFVRAAIRLESSVVTDRHDGDA